MRKLIGLSLSFCVKDILLGRIKEDEVFLIFYKANPTSPAAIDQYKQTYWKGFATVHIEGVLERLESRLHLLDDEVLYIPNSVWVDSSQPHFWGPVNDGIGMEGTFLRFELNGDRVWSKSNGMFPVTTNHAKDMS